MKLRVLSIILCAIALCDTAQASVDTDFASKQKLVGFTINKQGLTTQELEALKFIYAYAPLSDVTGYSQDFYIANIRQTFKTRQETAWGNKIPDNIFRHFVLPVRVNNEALDNFRTTHAAELQARVKGMTMKEAALEVNHWCHERVTYQPSDARTSTPLNTIKTATGRCGEESTLAVAALRAVGIPARQVYTPRWAHTDDNHAWVEAWADGEWYFLGACEPEPVLNLGWFNAPASRAMLMHTRVFGNYNGPEETVLKTNNYTEVNLVGNYAPTALVNFQVVDTKGHAVAGAKVEFKIYNYAEFFSAVTKFADKQGHTSLNAGKGDMLVWASDKAGNHGYKKVSFGKDTQVTIVLNNQALPQAMGITPPAQHANMPLVTDKQVKVNKMRLQQEDSMRAAYTATFVTEKDKEKYSAEQLPYLIKSRGNHATIEQFFAKYASQSERARQLLDGLSDKDLRDVTMEVLDDNMTAGSNQLSPRVEDEPLVPFKHYLEEAFKKEAKAFKANPQLLVQWIKKNIRLNPDKRALNYAQNVVGVHKYRITDKRSRDIFFVATARSLDIDARKDLITGKVQYRMAANQPWVDVKWEVEGMAKVAPQGTLVVNYANNGIVDNPKYYSHFTLSKIENGQIQLLNYAEDNVDWQNTFKDGAKLDVGHYVLVSGTRLASGGVLVSTREFDIKKDQTTSIDLELRKEEGAVMVIGNFDSESRFNKLDMHACTIEQQPVSILSQTGRGYYVLGIIGVGQEPTNHALRDMAKVSPDRPTILLFEDEADARKLAGNDFGLPQNIIYGVDSDHSIFNALKGALKLPNSQLPVFVIADTFNRIVFSSQGYTIGLGDQLKTTLLKIKQ